MKPSNSISAETRFPRLPTSGEETSVSVEVAPGVTTTFALPADAVAAKVARTTAEVRGFFRVKEFAAAIGKNHYYVASLCRAKVIKTMMGGKPYRIPFAEYENWLTNGTRKPSNKPAWLR